MQIPPDEGAYLIWAMHLTAASIPTWLQEGTWVEQGTDVGIEGMTGHRTCRRPCSICSSSCRSLWQAFIRPGGPSRFRFNSHSRAVAQRLGHVIIDGRVRRSTEKDGQPVGG